MGYVIFLVWLWFLANAYIAHINLKSSRKRSEKKPMIKNVPKMFRQRKYRLSKLQRLNEYADMTVKIRNEAVQRKTYTFLKWESTYYYEDRRTQSYRLWNQHFGNKRQLMQRFAASLNLDVYAFRNHEYDPEGVAKFFKRRKTSSIPWMTS